MVRLIIPFEILSLFLVLTWVALKNKLIALSYRLFLVGLYGCGILIPPAAERDRWGVSFFFFASKKKSGNLESLVNVIIPFFEKYPLQGAKALDFNDFVKGIRIIEKKGHLTPEGLAQLQDLAYGMNTFRKF